MIKAHRLNPYEIVTYDKPKRATRLELLGTEKVESI